MINVFLNHQWKAFWRSRNKGASIAAQVFLGIAILYLLVLALAVGFGMELLIGKVLPEKDVFYVFNGIILYYFAVDFLMRLQLQELPTLSIVPYLHLNIPKQKIVSYLNIRCLFSVFNLLPLIIFIPFCSTAIADVYGPLVSTMYILAIVSLCIFNNYTAMYTKRLTTISVKAIFLVVIIIVCIALLEYYSILSITALSNRIFSLIDNYPLLGFAFLVAAIAMFRLNSIYLRQNMYTEELESAPVKRTSTDYPFLDRFGAVGVFLALELKLILRHKRSRSAIVMSLFFMLYGFLFYKQELLARDEIHMMIFAAIFMTGSTISIYGQFMFGWQGAYFDGLLANPMNLKDFIKAKFLLFTCSATIVTLAISLYGFISWKILAIQIAAYLYNIGLGSVIVLYFATRNTKAVDLSKGATFNYQGVSATQFILLIPYLLIPYIFYLPFAITGNPYRGVACLALAGLIGLVARGYFVSFITNELYKKRYKLAEGYRER